MIRESGREQPVEADATTGASCARAGAGPLRFRVNRRAFPAFLLLAAAAAAAGCLAQRYRSNPRVTVVDGDPIVQMKSPNAFPAVVKPSLVDPRQHSDPPDADSRVLGLAVGAVPRAYPIGLLDRFEVVNDGVPGLPFVVARCALIGVAAIYDRRAGGHVLEFRNSGTLWRDSLVLQDRETGTYWSAATGRAHGPLAGERLRPVPAVLARVSAGRGSFRAPSTWISTGTRPFPSSSGSMARRNGKVSREPEDRDSRHRPKETVFTVAGRRGARVHGRRDQRPRAAWIQRSTASQSRSDGIPPFPAPRAPDRTGRNWPSWRCSGSRPPGTSRI